MELQVAHSYVSGDGQRRCVGLPALKATQSTPLISEPPKPSSFHCEDAVRWMRASAARSVAAQLPRHYPPQFGHALAEAMCSHWEAAREAPRVGDNNSPKDKGSFLELFEEPLGDMWEDAPSIDATATLRRVTSHDLKGRFCT